MGKHEGKVQKKKINELEAKGYYVIKLGRTNKNGIPDILAIPPNSDVEFYEVKTKDGVVSPLQKFRIKELKAHGIKAEIHREE